MLHKSWIRLALALLIGIGLMVGAATVYAKTQIVQNTKTFLFTNPDGSFVDGFPTIQGSSVNLRRTADGVSIKVNTKDLPPGEYTNWWVIFDNPGACGADGCDDGGFGNMAVDAAVFLAAGGSVGQNGKGKFNADLAKGVLPIGDGQEKVVFGGPLDNPLSAEIHYVIRYHGPFESEDLLQTSTLGGGCTPGSTAPNSGPPGEFECYDPQAAINPAP